MELNDVNMDSAVVQGANIFECEGLVIFAGYFLFSRLRNSFMQEM